MTATYNPTEVERLVREAREALADLNDPDHAWFTANGADVIDQLEAAQTEIARLTAALPNWSHAEALQQRDAMIAANVEAQAELRRLRSAQTVNADRLHAAIALVVKESLDGRGEARDNGAFAELVADRVVDVLTEPK